MSATIEDPYKYPSTRAQRHPDCWVCSPSNTSGLAVEFEADESGAVEGVFSGGAAFTGYPGLLHGGVISALLDGAMTNCLMARGTPGLTARLEVRFLKPVAVDQPVTVRGWWENPAATSTFWERTFGRTAWF